MGAEDLIKKLIELLLKNLEELKDFCNKKEEQFQYGEKTAYIECLEYLQMWEFSDRYGLNFEIEDVYLI